MHKPSIYYLFIFSLFSLFLSCTPESDSNPTINPNTGGESQVKGGMSQGGVIQGGMEESGGTQTGGNQQNLGGSDQGGTYQGGVERPAGRIYPAEQTFGGSTDRTANTVRCRDDRSDWLLRRD